MSAWPDYALILADGYNESRNRGMLRDDMDSGIAKQRARFTKSIVTRSITIAVLSRADKVAFDAWVENDLDGGALWFDYPDGMNGGTVRGRIVGGDVKWSEPAGQLCRAQLQVESIG